MRNHDRLQLMDVRSAEFTKYAANAMLATRISFMNELALLAEKVGADIEMVRSGIGSDPRIGTHFLYPGTGYGGSCFPKDVKALVHTGKRRRGGWACWTPWRRQRPPEARAGGQGGGALRRDLSGRRFALWGLAFKPNTDDMREAPSRTVVAELTPAAPLVQAYDPVAMEEARRVMPDMPGLRYARQLRCRRWKGPTRCWW
jgi:UDPglucose 6-dehydrogenase